MNSDTSTLTHSTGSSWHSVLARLFPKSVQALEDRKNYAVTDRGSVEKSTETGNWELQFYPRTDAPNVETIALDELRTGRSPNDNALKIWVTIILLVQALLPVALFFADEVFSGLGLGALVSTIMETGVLPALIISANIFVFTSLRVLFTRMDANWSNSIRSFLENDTKNKMQGIRACLLEFRRFVKWRRYMSYLQAGVIALFIMQIPILFLLPAAFANSEFGWTWHELAAVAAMLFIQVPSIIAFLYLRWFYTDGRDPTVQLCVMLAEERIDYVALLRRGARD